MLNPREIGAEIPGMGWFGFGGSRERDDRYLSDARRGDRDGESRYDTRRLHEAVRIDRAGKPSHLPQDRPRRRDRR